MLLREIHMNELLSCSFTDEWESDSEEDDDDSDSEWVDVYHSSDEETNKVSL